MAKNIFHYHCRQFSYTFLQLVFSAFISRCLEVETIRKPKANITLGKFYR